MWNAYSFVLHSPPHIIKFTYCTHIGLSTTNDIFLATYYTFKNMLSTHDFFIIKIFITLNTYSILCSEIYNFQNVKHNYNLHYII